MICYSYPLYLISFNTYCILTENCIPHSHILIPIKMSLSLRVFLSLSHHEGMWTLRNNSFSWHRLCINWIDTSMMSVVALSGREPVFIISLSITLSPPSFTLYFSDLSSQTSRPCLLGPDLSVSVNQGETENIPGQSRDSRLVTSWLPSDRLFG